MIITKVREDCYSIGEFIKEEYTALDRTQGDKFVTHGTFTLKQILDLENGEAIEL